MTTKSRCGTIKPRSACSPCRAIWITLELSSSTRSYLGSYLAVMTKRLGSGIGKTGVLSLFWLAIVTTLCALLSTRTTLSLQVLHWIKLWEYGTSRGSRRNVCKSRDRDQMRYLVVLKLRLSTSLRGTREVSTGSLSTQLWELSHLLRMTKPSSCGDFLGISIGKWTLWKRMETTYLVLFSIHDSRSCFPIQRIKHSDFGIWIAELRSIKLEEIRIGIGSLLLILPSIISHLVTTMVWACSRLKGSAMLLRESVPTSFSSKTRTSTIMTFPPRIKLWFQP